MSKHEVKNLQSKVMLMLRIPYFPCNIFDINISVYHFWQPVTFLINTSTRQTLRKSISIYEHIC